MLIKNPCHYNCWQELIVAHSQVLYQAYVGFLKNDKAKILPYLIDQTGQFTLSRLVPVPQSINTWDRDSYPSNWFISNWGSLTDISEIKELETEKFYYVVFTINGLPIHWLKSLHAITQSSTLLFNFYQLKLEDSHPITPSSIPPNYYSSTLLLIDNQIGFSSVNGQNQNFVDCYPRYSHNFLNKLYYCLTQLKLNILKTTEE
ncbi:hypothetical protein [Crocosphaera chwakensis]|uniref:Uncharacterized protein n=1 Tax=Crocosphaera chwakensis CCY0110 TaxID=391612 RepID=A3IYX2_9CHRO|nr:hypothetical protein [Crocosphaera chwakensis]EAZ88312.1 hypothetical protein CY0110_14800 [Crocosphaera chwakensis CCY0110]